MLIFTKIADLQAFLRTQRALGRTVGFVPTMGALHEGHLSLIARSRAECGVTLCSIFVNPTQFNDPLDLERYPRTPSEDQKMLEKAGCDALFMPKVGEMYPNEKKSNILMTQVSEVLEGAHRPGHFKGVAQVVKRFFEIIEPDKAYFGSKDYQQVQVIKALVKQMKSPVEVVACPTQREPDGLAMSSRNKLLDKTDRQIASQFPRILRESCEIARSGDISAAKKHFNDELLKQPNLKLEYFEICDPETLQVLDGRPGPGSIALAAVWLNKIRLIDNMPVQA